jgi:hypothetical protein
VFKNPVADPADKIVEIGFYVYEHECFPDLQVIHATQGYTILKNIYRDDSTAFSTNCATWTYSIGSIGYDEAN